MSPISDASSATRRTAPRRSRRSIAAVISSVSSGSRRDARSRGFTTRMMRRLFWRIFAAFWLATVVVLLAFAWITTSNFESEKIPGLGVTRLQAAMDDLLSRTSRELRHDGIEPTKEWLRSAADFGSIVIYVFGPNGKEMLGRETTEAIRAASQEVIDEAKT